MARIRFRDAGILRNSGLWRIFFAIVSLFSAVSLSGCCVNVSSFERGFHEAIRFSALGLCALSMVAVFFLVLLKERKVAVPSLIVSLPVLILSCLLAFLVIAYNDGALNSRDLSIVVSTVGPALWTLVSVVFCLVQRKTKARLSSADWLALGACALLWAGWLATAIFIVIRLSLPAQSTVAQLSITSEMPCARYESGKVACWPRGNIHFPVLSDATYLSTSARRGCAVRRTGQVACWNKETGRLDQKNVDIPDATTVSVGTTHQCVLLRNGKVQCWGENAQGQLGRRGLSQSDVPLEVPGLDSAIQLETMASTTCALRSQGDVYCWGSNSYGQVGNGQGVTQAGSNDVQSEARAVVDLVDAKSVAVGWFHACALRRTGQVVCWGIGGTFGTSTEVPCSLPVEVPEMCAVVELHAGAQHSCVRCTTGEVRCWGSNSMGELTGTPLEKVLPSTVDLNGPAESLDIRDSHSCVRIKGQYFCWGANTHLELGVWSREDCGTDLFEKPMCTREPSAVRFW